MKTTKKSDVKWVLSNTDNEPLCICEDLEDAKEAAIGDRQYDNYIIQPYKPAGKPIVYEIQLSAIPVTGISN